MRKFDAPFPGLLAVLGVMATIPIPGTMSGTSQAAPADSGGFSQPAPLLVPGQAPDSAVTRSDRALGYYQRGRAYEAADKRAAALQAYQNAVLADPTFPDAYFRLGLLYQGVGNHEEARQCFAEELRYHPDRDEARRELGFSLAQLGDTERALGYLEGYIEEHPEDGLGWYGLGFAYMRNSQSARAEEALRKAISLGGTNAVWHRDLGAVLAARGAVDEARAEYHIALQLSPENPTPYINLGNLDRRAGDLDEALESYRKAEAVDSTLSIALHAQAQVLQEMNRPDEAAAVYLRWVAVRPQEHATRLQAARYLHQIGRSGEAVDLALQGVRLAPGSGEAQTVLGLTLYATGDVEGALSWLLKAESSFKTPPEKARLRSMLGRMKQEAPDSLRAKFPPDSLLGIGG